MRVLHTPPRGPTQLALRAGGFYAPPDMARLAWTCSRAKLTKHENELQYLKEELKKAKSGGTNPEAPITAQVG